MALSQLGYEVEHGAGVGAAQRVFVEAGVARRGLVLEQQYKVLVKEKIADSGVDMLRERFAVDVGVDWTRRGARGAHRRLPRDPHPLGDEADRRPDRPRRQPAA